MSGKGKGKKRKREKEEDGLSSTSKTSKSQGKAIYKVDVCQKSGSCCPGTSKTCGGKISKGQVRCRFRTWKIVNIHPRCLTIGHIPKMNHLEECEGFTELSADNQTLLREISTAVHEHPSVKYMCSNGMIQHGHD